MITVTTSTFVVNPPNGLSVTVNATLAPPGVAENWITIDTPPPPVAVIQVLNGAVYSSITAQQPMTQTGPHTYTAQFSINSVAGATYRALVTDTWAAHGPLPESGTSIFP